MEVAHAILGNDIYKVIERDGDAESDHSDPVEIGIDALRRAEAILFATTIPIAAGELVEMLPPGVDVADILMQLQKTYAGRGIQLMEIAGGWRFQTAPDLAFLFEETREEEKKLSKAAMETLSIIAYCQPCTRAEIEDVRGVAVSKGTLDVLLEMDWIKLRGRRKTPGRPVVYGTTNAFLEHFGIDGLDSLPGREEMKAAGLLSANIPDDFDMPRPSESEADEDLLEIIDSIEDGLTEPAEFHTDFSKEDDQ
ncbi:chromosome segregation and condensation protein, ScpB [Hirschia baltica ATCC 49814]|uniref:Chromosome segregation and condensation protein, ScpB n=2 Tax=Hirschia TaxID=2723 RepID=C6XIZ2_HIRBI|nr:chromosome segregation and condensation protein, ScpB [Hirschia baltica ATCC 49814]